MASILVSRETAVDYKVSKIKSLPSFGYFLSFGISLAKVSHVIPSVDNFHKFAIPAISAMQPLYGAALI